MIPSSCVPNDWKSGTSAKSTIEVSTMSCLKHWHWRVTAEKQILIKISQKKESTMGTHEFCVASHHKALAATRDLARLIPVEPSTFEGFEG